ncbi:MAG: AAA family ATPase, partial [bacterium]|nr:AAA family ATPase [bacterium]
MNYIPRLVDAQLARALRTHPVVLVTGARGVGKTTTAQQLAKSCAFFDDTATVTVFQDNPEAALGQFQEPLLVDEWQLAPEVVRAIKRTVVRDRRPGRFILTVSPEPQSRSVI